MWLGAKTEWNTERVARERQWKNFCCCWRETRKVQRHVINETSSYRDLTGVLCPLQIHRERVTNKPPSNSVGRRWICSRVRAIKIFADASVDLAREEKLIFPVRFFPKFCCCRIGNLLRCCSLQFITGIKTDRSKTPVQQWNNKSDCYSLGCKGEFIQKPPIFRTYCFIPSKIFRCITLPSK